MNQNCRKCCKGENIPCSRNKAGCEVYDSYQQGRADERNSFFNFDEVIRIECEKAKADERKKVISEQKEYIEYILSILTDEQLVLVIEKGEQLKE